MPDVLHKRIYVADYGKMQISGYDLDSVLLNPDYLPKYKLEMNKAATPVMLSYGNDTLVMLVVLRQNRANIFKSL